MNPWVTIWFKPRQTIRHIVNTNPRHLVLPIVITAGAIEGFTYPRYLSARFRVSEPLTTPIAIGLGVTLSVTSLYVFGWLYRWVGSWFKGQARNVEVRATIAWLKIPVMVGLFLWFCSRKVSLGFHPLGVFLFIAGYVVLVWGGLLKCHALGEVHHFSAWKGLGTIVITNVLVWIPILVLGFVVLLVVVRARFVP